MATRFRSLASVFALAFAVLFFGPSTARVDAQQRHGGGYSNHHGGYSNHGGGYSHHRKSYGKYGHRGSYYGHGAYRPYSGPYQPYGSYYGGYPGCGYYGGYPAYRVVRVFVYFPFPHWTYRRVPW